MTARNSPVDALPDVSSAESTVRSVDDVELHVVTAGETDAPLVVCLHGFPEFWYGWSEYIKPFVDAGYRVLVPDQRGYNLSEKPAGIRPYRLSRLSADIVALLETEGRESAHVVGHDWGAAVAWDLALRYPETVDRLGIVNVPHPSVFIDTLRSSFTQLFKSSYIATFQIPKLPEWYIKRTDFEPWVSAMRDGSQPGTFTEEAFDRYRRAWAQTGAPTAMINWYRALFRHRPTVPREHVTVPTRVVWGENDQALVPEMAEQSLGYCEQGDLKRFPEATHWITHEHPDRVAALLLDHFRR
ncbi:alpha/beta fold hydrolase [Halocatena pleomorpha]|uniref:Alpha/beta hydrolase n=1 Tax=Halocatena pleomorpha TaxID=1785090 RepID=A0A3P3R6H1_9EURY|nr:alpha/beta hydrolase [Halocatena pleomorpha]RRJ28578.1 alpha/beta hydrolase [Halocatena pleomorpha]